MKTLPATSRIMRARRDFVRCSLGAGGLLLGTNLGRAAQSTQTLKWKSRALIGFGTTLWLRAAHPDGTRADRALDAAVHELRAIEATMSLFKADSELSQLNRYSRLSNPDARLVELIRMANTVSRASDGAFDVSVQPLWTAWQSAAQAARLPTAKELDDARARVGWQSIQIDERQIRLKSGMALTLNGIAQGYAADRVRALLVAHGIEHALLDTGEWSALAPDFKTMNWRLGVANPRIEQQLIATLVADGRSIATSSDQHTRFSADSRHHHIFDPRTGFSPTSLSSVTVLAASCALADALTKVFFMIDRSLREPASGTTSGTKSGTTSGLAKASEHNVLIRQARTLIERWPVDVLLVDKQGHWWASEGLPLV
jgi:FAD:protein FMN transferase